MFDVIYDTTVAQQVERVVQWLEGSNPAPLQYIAVFLGNTLTLNCSEWGELTPCMAAAFHRCVNVSMRGFCEALWVTALVLGEKSAIQVQSI